MKYPTSTFALFVSVGVYIVLRTWGLWVNDLWNDEVFSAVAVREGWAELFNIIIKDGVHPPLFYILLKAWSLASQSVWWLQLLPVLISFLTIIPVYLLCRETELTLSEKSALFLIMAVNDYQLAYAFELRMYGLLQFFALLSLWLFIKMQKSDKTSRLVFFSLIFINFLLVFTHYFGWLFIGLEGLYLLIWQRRIFLKFSAYSFGILLAFSLWIWLVLQKVAGNESIGNLAWIARPSIFDPIWFYATLNGNLHIENTTLVNVAIFSLPICVLIWQAIKQNERDAQILALFSFAPTILTFVASYLLPKSIWQDRYLIISAVPYQILLIKSLFSFSNTAVRVLAISVVLIWSLAAGFHNLLRTPKKIQWSSVVKEIDSGQVFVFEDWVELPLRFYSERSNKHIEVKKTDAINEVPSKNFEIVYRLPVSASRDTLQNHLLENKCGITERDEFVDLSHRVVLLKLQDCDLRRWPD